MLHQILYYVKCVVTALQLVLAVHKISHDEQRVNEALNQLTCWCFPPPAGRDGQREEEKHVTADRAV